VPDNQEHINGWTVQTLHNYILSTLREMDKRYEQRWAAQQTALNKVEASTQDRFASVNEFRAVLSDQQHTYITRTEYERAHQYLIDKANDNSDRLNRLEGSQSGVSSTVATLIAVIGVVAAFGAIIAVVVIHH
jgi:ABC-type multidrug transport system fused ATPase/permease subunit